MNLARSTLEYDMAFIELLNRSTSERYRVPKAYGIIDDGRSSYLVMDCLEDANDIAAVYQDLRNDHRGLFQELIQSWSLTPLRHWWPQGYIFFRDYDGCRLVDDAHDFTDFMSTRFKEAEIDSNLVPLNEASVFIHGNPGPDNLMRCSDGKIGLLHFHMSFFGPPWWEFYALHGSPAPDRWLMPLKKAMALHGMAAPDGLIGELDEKFIFWFTHSQQQAALSAQLLRAHPAYKAAAPTNTFEHFLAANNMPILHADTLREFLRPGCPPEYLDEVINRFNANGSRPVVQIGQKPEDGGEAAYQVIDIPDDTLKIRLFPGGLPRQRGLLCYDLVDGDGAPIQLPAGYAFTLATPDGVVDLPPPLETLDLPIPHLGPWWIIHNNTEVGLAREGKQIFMFSTFV
ncbi:hypothetical protein B0H16DRAFT_1724711 [Mycena metata]|uniref:Uncharacterized protein n=1 Tax=Mycena metata TaxID=1033252 RepID=A0AAD7IVT5_9AGAR|nr:hypothetical protein B0H16DRAFT_1724711 [Mycena metata]